MEYIGWYGRCMICKKILHGDEDLEAVRDGYIHKECAEDQSPGGS